MIRAPHFWQEGGWPALLLSPLEAITGRVTARRVARQGWQAPVPVICCGNATVGGAGKTTLALDLGRRLVARGIAVHFLTRGHGGSEAGPLQVDPARHDAGMVGDEPLLLAGLAPCWVSRDRAAGARAAVAAGAGLILMDDGLQNPALRKDLTLLVIDGGTGFGNGRLLPAGPLRESVTAASSRCQSAVLIGEDRCGALAALPRGLPILRASLEQAPPEGLTSGPVLAFAGIGHPEKFRATLMAVGIQVAELMPFPDHHPYTRADIDTVLRRAASLGARPVTTPKDAIRLPPGLREQVAVAGVRLRWQDETAIDTILATLLAA